MHTARHYRDQAARARRLAEAAGEHEAADILRKIAGDFDEIAEDLENGAVEIRHPERMPQTRN